jgi:hypothetical protein
MKLKKSNKRREKKRPSIEIAIENLFMANA